MDGVTDGGGPDVGVDVAILRCIGVGAGVWTCVGFGLGGGADITWSPSGGIMWTSCGTSGVRVTLFDACTIFVNYRFARLACM